MAIAETTGEIQAQESPMRGIATNVSGVSQRPQRVAVTAPPSFSQRTFVVDMPDNSMVPEIRPGEYVVFDPEVLPDPGDVVLLQDEDGGLWIRKYRSLPRGQFDAIAANQDHALLHSRDGLRVLAVMVAHWRGRRSFTRSGGAGL